jgi:gamma-glutamylcyclotransferase (GGCT)/AIG2-like uncharacterized protein YtfP
MPLCFSYGSLQQEQVQLSTVGRRLEGQKDDLLQFETSSVRIDDPRIVTATLTFTGRESSRVAGVVFEITDVELASLDAYEATFSYTRVAATLASGRQAWVYVHAPRSAC